MTETEQAIVGDVWARILLLKKKRNGRYDTAWGDKTPLGLYKTIVRMVGEREKTLAESKGE